VGFFRGLSAPFRGAYFIARERLWAHLVAPILVNLALGVTTLVVASRFMKQELAQPFANSPIFGAITLGFFSVLGGVLLFILLQPLMSAIFCDRLAEVVEKRVRKEAPKAPLLSSIGKALLHGLMKLALYGLAIGVGLGLTAVLTGIGTLVGVGLGAVFLAYDGFDYPLARRDASFAAKWAYLAKHPALALGFGLGSYFVYLVPLAFLVAPPFAAVGATLAFLEDETRAEAVRARKQAAAKGAPAAPPSAAEAPAETAPSN
jgi:CysZ protein